MLAVGALQCDPRRGDDLLRPDRWSVSRWTLRPLVPAGRTSCQRRCCLAKCRQRTTSSRCLLASWFVRTSPQRAGRGPTGWTWCGCALASACCPRDRAAARRQRPESRSPGCRVPEQGAVARNWFKLAVQTDRHDLSLTRALGRPVDRCRADPARVAASEAVRLPVRAGKMLRPGEAGSPPALVRSPWNAFDAKRTNLWDTFRVFAAFHVYVHLAFLGQAAVARTEDRSLEGVPDRTVLEQKIKAAAHRARYLSEQLTSDIVGTNWARRGRPTTALLVDRNPRCPRRTSAAGGSCAASVDRPLPQGSNSSAVTGITDRSLGAVRAATDELDQARALLGALGAKDALPSSAPDATDALSDVFYRLRRSVAVQLRNSSPDGYRLGGGRVDSEPLDQLAGQLIESSSVRLSELLPSTNESLATTGPGNRGERVCDPATRGRRRHP